MNGAVCFTLFPFLAARPNAEFPFSCVRIPFEDIDELILDVERDPDPFYRTVFSAPAGATFEGRYFGGLRRLETGDLGVYYPSKFDDRFQLQSSGWGCPGQLMSNATDKMVALNKDNAHLIGSMAK